MRNGTFFIASHRLSPTTEPSHVMCLNMRGVQKSLKRPNEERVKKKGGLDLFETRIFTKAIAVDAVPCPWCVLCCQHPLSVFLFSCSAVQNHVDRPSQRSSPRPVSHDPCLSLDHTKADSMSSASACVCASSR